MLSKELQHPFTRTLTFCFDAWLCQWEGDAGAVRERAKDALAMAREQGFEFWIGWGEMMLGGPTPLSATAKAGSRRCGAAWSTGAHSGPSSARRTSSR